MKNSGRLALVALIALVCLRTPCPAQEPASAQQPSAPGYTLNVNSRLVVEDVSVTDGKGNPVTKLPASAFHVFDNDVPQPRFQLREQTSSSTQPGPTSRAFTNATLLQDRGTVVAILIDPADIELQDQMYLRLQALRFVDTLPANAQLTIFRANNRGVPVLLQPPTSDRALLHTALTTAIPVMKRPVDSTFENAITELGNVSAYLRPIPGRKALLWLAGRFPLYEPPDFALGSGDEARNAEETKEAFRAVQDARIAVYPIDVRGVVMGGMSPAVVIDTQAAALDPSTIPPHPLSESAKASGQYDTMDQIAFATGGRAFYSNNGITREMAAAIHLASDSYTISYEPGAAAASDGKWHKVRITVDGPYTAHFRTGYFAPDHATAHGDDPRRVLSADTSITGAAPAALTAAVSEPPPLIFSARVLSADKRGKDEVVKLRFVIPTAQLHFDSAAGHAHFRVAALAYNAWGDVLSRAMEIVDTHYSPDQMQIANRIGTPADQTVEVAKGAQFLLLAVEDLTTEKVGTLQISLSSLRAEKSAGQ